MFHVPEDSKVMPEIGINLVSSPCIKKIELPQKDEQYSIINESLFSTILSLFMQLNLLV